MVGLIRFRSAFGTERSQPGLATAMDLAIINPPSTRESQERKTTNSGAGKGISGHGHRTLNILRGVRKESREPWARQKHFDSIIDSSIAREIFDELDLVAVPHLPPGCSRARHLRWADVLRLLWQNIRQHSTHWAYNHGGFGSGRDAVL